MDFNYSVENTSVKCNILGRIDTNTAPVLEGELSKLWDTYSVFELNFSDVDYISFVGLRVLLKLYKSVSPRNGSVTLKNVTDMVRSVLDETGFSDLYNM